MFKNKVTKRLYIGLTIITLLAPLGLDNSPAHANHHVRSSKQDNYHSTKMGQQKAANYMSFHDGMPSKKGKVSPGTQLPDQPPDIDDVPTTRSGVPLTQIHTKWAQHELGVNKNQKIVQMHKYGLPDETIVKELHTSVGAIKYLTGQ